MTKIIVWIGCYTSLRAGCFVNKNHSSVTVWSGCRSVIQKSTVQILKSMMSISAFADAHSILDDFNHLQGPYGSVVLQI
jgi:hypothetical protein